MHHASAPRHVVLLALLLTAVFLPITASAAESLVLAWNTALLDAVRADNTPPPCAARNLAIAHLILDEAAHAPTGRPEALVPISGCAAASALYPARRTVFEALRNEQLATLSPGASADEWQAAAVSATRCLETRSEDGSTRFVNYVPRTGAGQWRRTAPFFRPPELPQWSHVQTFAITDPQKFLPAGPPPLDSMTWQGALDEIRRLGGKANAERTAEETQIARFWSDFSYTTTPPGHWNLIAQAAVRQAGFDEKRAARLFAVLNAALADAGIACWEAKYRYNFWRPITVLGEHEGWQPLLNTPPHPEYPSGHSAFSGAAATVLAALTGSDEREFTVRSDALPGVERRFLRFSDAAHECGQSRIYAGIHYRFSCDDGLALGRAVAREVLRHYSTAPEMAHASTAP